jgi:hypothetical protein
VGACERGGLLRSAARGKSDHRRCWCADFEKSVRSQVLECIHQVSDFCPLFLF